MLEKISLITFSDLISLLELWVSGAFNYNEESLTFKHEAVVQELEKILQNKCEEAHLGSYVARNNKVKTNRSFFLNKKQEKYTFSIKGKFLDLELENPPCIPQEIHQSWTVLPLSAIP